MQNITTFCYMGSGKPSDLTDSVPSRQTNPVLKEINYQHSAQKGDPKGADSSLTVPKKMSSSALYFSGFSLEVSLCYQIIWANGQKTLFSGCSTAQRVVSR